MLAFSFQNMFHNYSQWVKDTYVHNNREELHLKLKNRQKRSMIST